MKNAKFQNHFYYFRKLCAMNSQLTYDEYPFLKELGLEKDNKGFSAYGKWSGEGEVITSVNPHNGKPIAIVRMASLKEYEIGMKSMADAQKKWMLTPAPKRGEVVRQLGNALREKKKALGRLISLEVGKIIPEGEGEVQMFIDMCDFVAGLSRNIPGQVFPSDKEGHLLVEMWNPLGMVGVITAFNYPHAAVSWSLLLSMICGNVTVWKPSPSTCLTAIATMKIFESVLKGCGIDPGVIVCCPGSKDLGEAVVNDARIKLVVFTGSTAVGRSVSERVHKRFGKTILELGGNNATVIMDDANIEVAVKDSFFNAIGMAGQRCTNLRRLLVHEKVYDDFVSKLVKLYQGVTIGDPLDSKTLVTPLHYSWAVKEFKTAIENIKAQGGKILFGGSVIENKFSGGNYVMPTIVEINQRTAPIVCHEFFMPILYLIKIEDLDDAIELNNAVPQGLSSSIYTKDMQNVFKWIGPTGSDCGVVNVNTGTTSTELGGKYTYKYIIYQVLSVAKRRLEVEGRLVLIHGNNLCGDLPVLLTMEEM
jgi:aldehyde dehydrogenase family 7 protein A1